MLLIQLLNALTYASVLFTMALGFSVIFGVMRLLHFGHAAFFMLAAFLTYQTVAWGLSIWAALVIVPVSVGIVAWLFEVILIRRVYNSDHLDQVLLTIGIAYLIDDLVRTVWGGDTLQIAEPYMLSGVLLVGIYPVPVYRLVVVGFSIAGAVALFWAMHRTRWGNILRAAIEDPEMAAVIGINTKALFTAVFVGATAITALSAVVVGPITQAYTGMDHQNLLLSLMVVIVGGLGSLPGVAIGALVLGLGDTFAKAWAPQFSTIYQYAVLLAVLIWRPQGLAGKREHVRV